MPRLKENVSTPEGVPRLFDLIKVQDERMKLAFYEAMRNTLVAKDLDQVHPNTQVFLMECVIYVMPLPYNIQIKFNWNRVLRNLLT